MSSRGINKFIKIIAVLILLPLSVVIPTLSLESYYASPTMAQQDTSASLAKREAIYRKILKEKIDPSVQDRIKLRCLAVQSNLKSFSEHMAEVQANRQARYKLIIAKLTNLEQRLKSQAFDSTKLEKNIAELSKKVAAFDANMEDQSQVASDLTVIDCSQDPTSFKAALETARKGHIGLIGEVADIRSFVLNSIKPTLEIVRGQLASQNNTGTQ
jgi:cytochrome c556